MFLFSLQYEGFAQKIKKKNSISEIFCFTPQDKKKNPKKLLKKISQTFFGILSFIF
tara:strand:+ start:115 stop:282 length:168 start_codon:yes stop_codon:yes gene_type:complete